MSEFNELEKLTRLVRYFILISTTAAGSGHVTSSLSAVELITTLFFKYFRYDLAKPDNITNDRFILSKGHASPLLYSLYAAAGVITEKELLRLRKFDSDLEGHPTPRFHYVEAATGSLGQGLSIGVGMAMAISRLSNTSKDKFYSTPKVYVLLGDGEMAEGQIWEAINLAGFYKLNNLIGILDVNRLGQSQQTILGHDIKTYAKQIADFGWQVEVIANGHDLNLINEVFSRQLSTVRQKPLMIIAKTVKGRGVSFLEDRNGWHGIALKPEELDKALKELGEVDKTIRGKIQKPDIVIPTQVASQENESSNKFPSKLGMTVELSSPNYKKGEEIATRKAFGEALVKWGELYPDMIVLDGDVQNSTYTELFAKRFPQRFFQMYIAEQNLVSVAVGMAKLGFRPLVSTFGAFLTRSYDQIRMAALSGSNIIFNGSHAGVSIGEDGPSQMGLEDITLFRSILGSTVLYPCDAVATEKLIQIAYNQKGIVYIRTTRPKTPVIYPNDEEFKIGGSKIFSYQPSITNRQAYSTLSSSEKRGNGKLKATIVAAGMTVFEALKAQAELSKEEIGVEVIDCYSVKPIDKDTLVKAASKTGLVITVEDHYAEGGLGDAVLEALAEERNVRVIKLAVTKTPHSGKPDELLDYEGISAKAIAEKVKQKS